MSHAPHETLPGYHPGQILVDGCEACERRAARYDRGISSLDPARFAWAWKRAAHSNQLGISDMSDAEQGILDILFSVQVQLERWNVPIGILPGKDMHLAPF